ncbi:hypothetical protein Rhe02_92840 [Rhizocola hellebori]|uniref:Uncharacterized protein n=1 Tax=Rhizocola hellebori TaxID=1392758 RepID=A0A8J3VM20_9ACTN|nr:hypothetical protein [Rhizocola hellebori]GIH11217.1 hypothetical protein Rhe02_92840 [Rhizocola hellebori]
MRRPERQLLDTQPRENSKSEFDSLLSWIDLAAHKWLPAVARHTMTLSDALANATTTLTEQQSTADARRLLLFPLAHHGIPQLTAGLFHQLIDACCEARRADARVLIAGLPVGRNERPAGAARTVDRIAELFRAFGWDVESAGDISALDGLGHHFATRARTTAYTRRAIDLPDLLAASACDAVETDWIYLADSVAPGRHLHGLSCTAPFGRLHTPGKPFAPPPQAAKRAPAGADQLWSAGLTLGLTDKVGIGWQWHEHLQAEVRAQLGPLWKKLMTAELTCHYGIRGEEPRRVTISGPLRDTAILPLFGAPRVSAATETLIATAAAIRPTTLVVDDVTPRIFYADYAADEIRNTYAAVAKAHGCQSAFLSGIEPADLASRIKTMLDLFTVGDLIEASPPGRANRSRGTFTGYDAIHLAAMAVACTYHADAALAAQAHNVPALQVITRRDGHAAIISRSGPPGAFNDHELRLEPIWLSKPFRGYP